MADISTNSLGRTQQAGQGTAFIYEPMSNTKPLDKLYNSILQEKARKDKMKVEQDKLKQKSGEDLSYRDWDRCINRDSKTSNEQR